MMPDSCTLDRLEEMLRFGRDRQISMILEPYQCADLLEVVLAAKMRQFQTSEEVTK